MSVHGLAHRTNNSIESYHQGLKPKFPGSHPNFWFFLDGLRKFIEEARGELECVSRGLEVRRKRHTVCLEKEDQIRRAEQLLDDGRVCETQFLAMVRRLIDLRHGVVTAMSVRGDCDDEGDDMDNDDCGPGGAAAGAADVCMLCLDSPARAVLIPCGHQRMCKECAGERRQEGIGCPACGVAIGQVLVLQD